MSYDFSLTTERSSLLGTESFRDHFSKALQNSQQHIYILSGYVKSNGVQWLKKELHEKEKHKKFIKNLDAHKSSH